MRIQPDPDPDPKHCKKCIDCSIVKLLYIFIE
jgi:hypothetical protein